MTNGKDETRSNANKRMSGCKHSGSDTLNGNNLPKEASKHEPIAERPVLAPKADRSSPEERVR